MLKYVIFAVVVAAPTSVLAADINMASITCQELFFEQPPATKDFVTAVNLQWFSGYYHGQASLTSIDTEKQHKLTVAVGQHCGLHRQEKVFDVYGRFFRETYQGNGQTAKGALSAAGNDNVPTSTVPGAANDNGPEIPLAATGTKGQ